MKLSEKIRETCCGVLADKEEMIKQAEYLEDQVELFNQICREEEEGLNETEI